MNKVLYAEWFPQIMYNHHQTGPPGAVMFAPPFRDPFNFNFDPLVPIGIDIVGAAMANRMAAEGKPGLTSRKGSSYSTWWNGGLRTTVLLSQHDRAADRDDRQSDAHHDSLRAVQAASGFEPVLPDRTAADVAFQAVDRLFGDRQLRRLRRRVPQQGYIPVQHLSDGEELHRAGQSRQLDDEPTTDCGRGSRACARSGWSWWAGSRTGER